MSWPHNPILSRSHSSPSSFLFIFARLHANIYKHLFVISCPQTLKICFFHYLSAGEKFPFEWFSNDFLFCLNSTKEKCVQLSVLCSRRYFVKLIKYIYLFSFGLSTNAHPRKFQAGPEKCLTPFLLEKVSLYVIYAKLSKIHISQKFFIQFP